MQKSRRELAPRKVVAAILAAGASSRFGSPKQLAQYGDETLIDRALDAATNTSAEIICVILGCHFEVIEEHLANRDKNGRFRSLKNTKWKDGLSSSIHTATRFAQEEKASHLLLMACDQPFVTSALLESLLKLVKNRPVPTYSNSSDLESIVACKYENNAGIPAIFPASYFNKLMKLSGDKGAKSVILSSSAPVLVDFLEGSQDIDHPGDLAHLLARD